MSDKDLSSVPFQSLFSTGMNGELSTLKTILVNGVLVSAGTVIPKDKLVAGVNFYDKTSWAVAVQVREDGVVVIRGFYVK
jgi:hypothetical protein